MASSAKRKRGAAQDPGENRPSPHRPQGSNLAQHDRGAEMRDGNRRSSRGGQGVQGRGGRRNDNRRNPNELNVAGNARTPAQGPMSPAPRPSTASQTPVQTPTTADVPLSLPSLPKREPRPFDYSFLTEDRLASWDSGGCQAVVEIGVQARQDEDTMDLTSLIQELVRATLDGKMDPAAAGSCVKDILGPDTPLDDSSSFDPHTTFLDIFSMVYDAEEGPMNPDLRPFAVATGVSPQLMRQKLDGPFLQELGLTRDTFGRVGVRQATNLLYRQANYNLLREETEGYSKLVTELFTTSGSEPPSSEVVEETFERVKGLIGTFDLDVGRVLDITLDVFAAVLIKHFRFFIKLLRVSSWWPRGVEIDGIAVSNCSGLPIWALPTSQGWLPEKEDEERSKVEKVSRDQLFWARAREIGIDAFFEIGGRQLVDEETKARILGGKRENDAELDAERLWIEVTGTLPPSGNRVAAQLLGFKLRFYTSTARGEEDKLPNNLIYLTALLIKVGFISLRDVYPHLWPLDEDMPAVREKRRKEFEDKEKSKQTGSSTNALAMAGALSDDTLPTNGRTRESATKVDPTVKPAGESDDKSKDDRADQKVQLLICLLTIGAIPEALFILGRFPWLPEAYPELIDLINRILNHSIKDVYETCRPVPSPQEAACPTTKFADADQSGVAKGDVRLTQLPVKKQLRWPFPDKSDTNDNSSYRFYWDEWADNVPVCQNVDDIFTLCSTFLNFSGVCIGKDPFLLSKLARIGSASLAKDRSTSNLARWQDLLKRLLVPALSITSSNIAVVNEIYDMLRFYHISVRFSIYAEWFEGTISRLPAMKIAFARAKHETERTMKRISKTNLTPMARVLAKIATPCPGIVFKIALSQIEAYTNLTDVVVECAKYFTDLGYDVLVWALLSSLGGKDRNRNNAEFALLPSRWLLALSRFSGKVFKRYRIMNLAPIIQYVSDQLYQGNSTDLVILKELIAQMSGIVPDTDYNDAQLAAMTGGEALRKQTLINLQDKRYESIKTSERLMRGLTDTNLAGELLIAIAQHRQAAIYKISDEDAHIKLLATMIDDTQLILFQYLDLLRSNLSPEDFDKQIPSIPELLEDFGLEPVLAFLIGRVGLAYRRSQIPVATQNGGIKSLPLPSEPIVIDLDAEGDTGMDSGENSAPINGEAIAKSLALADEPASQESVAMVDGEEGTPMETTPVEITQAPSDPYHDIMEPIIATIQRVLPEGSFRHLSPDFYSFFWSCSMGDLAVPSASYDAEITRIMAREKEKPKIDRGDSVRAAAVIRKELEDRQKADVITREGILTEFRKAVTSFGQKKARLLINKAAWFDKSVKADDMSIALLERCLIPRLLLSPSDADYTFRMIKFLHDNGIPQFRTLSLYGMIFRANRLRSIIFTCTVREAECLGRFLRLAFTDLARWHSDKAIYEKEAWGKNLPGFAKALDEEGKPKGFVAHDGNKGFKSILYHWHKNLNTAIRDCLEGTEWMHIRNAITVLKSVVDVFPAVDFMGNGFIKQLQVLTEREKPENNGREDLLLTGNTVLVQLKKRSPKWVMIQAFAHILVDASQINGTPVIGRSTSIVSSSSLLKPTAQDFKPKSSVNSLGITVTRPTTLEVEDGEVMVTPIIAAGPGMLPPRVEAPEPKAVSAVATTMESKRSEVLEKREAMKKEQAANAAKAAGSVLPNNPRTELARSSIMERSSPSLPSRPEAPFPSRDLMERNQPPRNSDRRDPREGRLPDRPDRIPDRVSDRLPDPRSLERGGPRVQDRGRDFSSGERRGPDPLPRDFGRPNERILGDRSRPEPPPQWNAGSSREPLDRANNGARIPENGRLSRDAPPPRIPGSTMDRGPHINPERLPLVNPERQEIINPARAALISGDKDVSRSDSPRRGRDDVRDRGPPRIPSPRRGEKEYTDSRRDDRRAGPPETYDSPRGRPDEAQHPPTGPRVERPADRDRNVGQDRSMFQPSQPVGRPMDLDHGRLNSASRSQGDPNFGRLNPVPSVPASDIPLGPRDRNSRGNRPNNPVNAGNPPPTARRDIGLELPRPPTPEKQPPSGPSGRLPRRGVSNQFTQNTNSPSTVAAPSPAPGIHPDRRAQLGPSAPHTPQQSFHVAPPVPVPMPVPAITTPGIHPDRMRGFEHNGPVRPMPPNMQMGNNRGPQQPPQVSTNGPPSGPRGAPSPVTPSVNEFTAPTGPGERTKGRENRQFRMLQDTIDAAKKSGFTPERNSLRGRGRQSSGMGSDTPNSGPPTPMAAPPPPMPIQSARHDLMNPERVDLINVGTPPDDRDRDRSGRRERGRHSRRSSRSPGRDRESKHSSNDHRESRDRRPGDAERDRHHVATPAKDLVPGRDGSNRDNGREREHRDRDSSRRDGREREPMREPNEAAWGGERPAGGERGAERGGRSRDVREEARGEERRDSRGNRDESGPGGSGRKRRSDEGADSRGHDKRPRR